MTESAVVIVVLGVRWWGFNVWWTVAVFLDMAGCSSSFTMRWWGRVYDLVVWLGGPVQDDMDFARSYGSTFSWTWQLHFFWVLGLTALADA
jgi:hypothetical protein